MLFPRVIAQILENLTPVCRPLIKPQTNPPTMKAPACSPAATSRVLTTASSHL